MNTCNKPLAVDELKLPREFEDLDGLLRADLKSVVAMIAQRAGERLLLTRREDRELRTDLWNNLAAAVNRAVEPLSADHR